MARKKGEPKKREFKEYAMTPAQKKELCEKVIKAAKKVIKLNNGHDIEFVMERGKR